MAKKTTYTVSVAGGLKVGRSQAPATLVPVIADLIRRYPCWVRSNEIGGNTLALRMEDGQLVATATTTQGAPLPCLDEWMSKVVQGVRNVTTSEGSA